MTSEKRAAAYPDVPALAERGFPGFDMNDWNGLFVQAGAPREAIRRMATAVGEACRDPGVRARMDPLGAEMVGNPPETFAAWLAAQRPVLARVIQEAGITLG